MPVRPVLRFAPTPNGRLHLGHAFSALTVADAPAEIARRKTGDDPFALRLDMGKALAIAAQKSGAAALSFVEADGTGNARRVVADPARWGDALLVRKETPASYHLAVVVDDARQGVTHVTRGTDLFAATDLHRLLQVLLDLPEPIYHHHRLITAPDGRKLAKSKGDKCLAALRAEGNSANDIRARLGFSDNL